MFNTGKMKKKVEELKKSGLIRKNEKILIAFSVGPDSVFLYNLLNFLKEEYSLEISLIYINHNLREDVGNDLKFVREFSEENNVPLYIESVNVKEYATENKKSIELAARELRYQAIERTLKNINYDLITYVQDRLGHDMRYAIDPSKIARDLGWYPETDFETGIRKTVKWYLENQEWVNEVASGDYQKYYEEMYGNK